MAKTKDVGHPDEQPSIVGAAGPDVVHGPSAFAPQPLEEKAIGPVAPASNPPLGEDEQLWELEYAGNKSLIEVVCKPGHEKSNQPEIEARIQFNALIKRTPSPRHVKARCVAKGAGIASAVLDHRAIELERAKRRGLIHRPEDELAILKARIAELEGSARKSA